MQIRPLCGHYSRVNTPLEGANYWRECCILTLPYQIDSLPGQVRLMLVLLTLPYQINSLPSHVRY